MPQQNYKNKIILQNKRTKKEVFLLKNTKNYVN